jgi:hypothetical protein
MRSAMERVKTAKYRRYPGQPAKVTLLKRSGMAQIQAPLWHRYHGDDKNRWWGQYWHSAFVSMIFQNSMAKLISRRLIIHKINWRCWKALSFLLIKPSTGKCRSFRCWLENQGHRFYVSCSSQTVIKKYSRMTDSCIITVLKMEDTLIVQSRIRLIREWCVCTFAWKYR